MAPPQTASRIVPQGGSELTFVPHSRSRVCGDLLSGSGTGCHSSASPERQARFESRILVALLPDF